MGLAGKQMCRGEIWWADLGEPRGSEPGSFRPVLIVSSDSYNRSTISTVTALGITSNTSREFAPGNVRLTKKQSGLPRVSVVNVSQLAATNKFRLVERVRKLDNHIMSKVDEGLRLALSL